MLPEIDILGAAIPTYALMAVIATVVGVVLVGWRLKELGYPVEWAGEAVFVASIAGLIGARMWWGLTDDSASGDLVRDFVDGGGLTWYGGLIGGAVGAIGWALARNVPLLLLADVAAPTLAFYQAIKRVGCQLAGDGDYGLASDLPWAMGYPDGVVPTPPGVTVHPTPVYEAIALTLIGIWLWRHRDSFRPGALFAFYLVLVGSERFLVEFIRRNEDVLGDLTVAQLTSFGLIAVGAAALVAFAHTGGLRTADSTNDGVAGGGAPRYG